MNSSCRKELLYSARCLSCTTCKWFRNSHRSWRYFSICCLSTCRAQTPGNFIQASSLPTQSRYLSKYCSYMVSPSARCTILRHHCQSIKKKDALVLCIWCSLVEYEVYTGGGLSIVPKTPFIYNDNQDNNDKRVWFPQKWMWWGKKSPSHGGF